MSVRLAVQGDASAPGQPAECRTMGASFRPERIVLCEWIITVPGFVIIHKKRIIIFAFEPTVGG